MQQDNIINLMEAITLNPKDANAYNNRGLSYLIMY